MKPVASLEKDIDVRRGLLMGQGVNLKIPGAKYDHVYIPWGDLASHMQVYGTTRQGKTRLAAFIARQIIEKGDHLVVVDPKGAEDQEFLSWIYQYATTHSRMRDVCYFSPEFIEDSIKTNVLYGLSNDEVSSLIQDMIKVVDEFYVDIANEILGAVLPALTFLESMLDEYIVEMMARMEYAKALVENPVNYANKKAIGKFYDPRVDAIKTKVYESMLREADGDSKKIKRLEEAYIQVKKRYVNSEGVFPIRAFVTFADFAQYTTLEKFSALEDIVKKTYNDLLNSDGTAEQLRMGAEAIRELGKITKADPAFFSKVSKTYAVTMAKVTTGNVGQLLNDSKINILRDSFYYKDRGIIMMIQPFPMRYSKAADMIVKMLLSMFNNLMANVGTSGKKFDRRIHVLVDEAGSVATPVLAHCLANKGGGLGLSLYMFTQSPADYYNSLGEDLAKILADNSNTKAFFMVNDDESSATISRMIGSKKRGEVTFGASEGQSSRTQSRAVDEALVPPHLISQLPKMTYVLKSGNEVWMMESPFQADPVIALEMPVADIRTQVQEFRDIALAEVDRDLI